MEPLVDEEELALQLNLLESELEKTRRERGDPTQNLQFLHAFLDKHALLLRSTTHLKLCASIVKLSKETDRLHLSNRELMDGVHQMALHSYERLAAAQDETKSQRAQEALKEIEKHLVKDYYPLFDTTYAEKQLEDFYNQITTHLRLEAALKLHFIQRYGTLKHPEALAALANAFADHNLVWFLGSPSFHELMGGPLEFPHDLNIADKAAALRGWLLSLSEKMVREVVNLDVQGRNLYLLPPEVSIFKYLKELHLENNHLSYFPQAIQKMHDLETVWIEGNAFSSLAPLSQQLPEHVHVIG